MLSDFISQVKGNPSKLSGKLISFAKLDIKEELLLQINHPMAAFVKKGLLVAEGDFQTYDRLSKFIKSELRKEMGDGFQDVLAKMNGMEKFLHFKKIPKSIEELEEFEVSMPVPAKIILVNSYDEMMEFEGDIFCVGNFRDYFAAIFALNAFSIVYQAIYKEQLYRENPIPYFLKKDSKIKIEKRTLFSKLFNR